MLCRSGSLLIAGDLNLHLDQPCRPEVKGFMDLLESADLKQQVRSKTHISGHLLDLLITRSQDDFLINVYVDRAGLSHVKRDHYPVTCSLNLQMKPQTKYVIRKCRQFRSINAMAFAEDVTTDQVRHTEV